MMLERGALLNNRYRIVDIVGAGERSIVYRAVDENLGADCAVKGNLFRTDEYARQFQLEAAILSNLRHPNLLRVTDYFVINDQGQYLVVDYLEGENLRQRMERVGNITEDEAILIGITICDVLTYLHTRNPSILHQNIKPENIMITSVGYIFLVGFDLVKVLQSDQVNIADLHTDVYSVGATLYAALSGVIIEDGLDRSIKGVTWTPLLKRNPKITKSLAQVVEKAMSIEPKNRFQSAEDLKQALLLEKRSPVLPQKLNVRNIFSWLSKK